MGGAPAKGVAVPALLLLESCPMQRKLCSIFQERNIIFHRIRNQSRVSVPHSAPSPPSATAFNSANFQFSPTRPTTSTSAATLTSTLTYGGRGKGRGRGSVSGCGRDGDGGGGGSGSGSVGVGGNTFSILFHNPLYPSSNNFLLRLLL